MTLDDLRMFSVRLPVHSWRYIYRVLKDEKSETCADLRQQLETGVPLAPFASGASQQIIADLERLSDAYIEFPPGVDSWDIWSFAAWLAKRYSSGDHIDTPADAPF